jgi:hypothetical protein
MMIAKQGIIITHAIALTALLIVLMGWQAQVQKKPTQTNLIGSMEPSFLDASNTVTLVPEPKQ